MQRPAVAGAAARGGVLASLPRPDAADVFFDLEGFPFASPISQGLEEGPESAERDARLDLVAVTSATHSFQLRSRAAHEDAADGGAGGREYLWGASCRPTGDGHAEYVSWWAHDHREERRAFEEFVDWATERRLASPSMHIYHYGSYEVSALRRLAGRHATREDEVDELLRRGVLVDLYETVRKAIAVGEPRYSIKNVERLYRSGRDTQVAKGDESVAAYEAWLQAPDGADVHSSPTLSALMAYNRDDCESTRELADWLWNLRCGVVRGGDESRSRETDQDGAPAEAEATPVSAAQEAEGVPDEAGATAESELLMLQDALSRTDWPDGCLLASKGVRETLVGLLSYHKREAKPMWWRRFSWLAAPTTDLIDEPATLGGGRTAPTKHSSAATTGRCCHGT